MSISIILTTIASIFIIIAMGYIAAKCGIIQPQESKFLSKLIMNVLLPCTLISSGSVDMKEGLVGEMLIAVVVIIAMYIFSAFICKMISRKTNVSESDFPAFMGTSILANSAFVGIPLITALIGTEIGMVYAAAAIIAFNTFFFTYMIRLFEGANGNTKLQWKNFVTPTNICTVLMIVMLVSGIRLPVVIQKSCSMVGACTTPLALFIVGDMLAGSDLKELLQKKILYLGTIFRNIIFPLLLLIVLKILPLGSMLCFGIMVLFSCPAANLTAVAAKQYGKGELFSSQAVAHSTLCYAVTGPIIILIAGLVFKI